MSVTEYKTPGWNTHREVATADIAWPLFPFSPDHFTIRRTLEGPRATTSAPVPLKVDSFFGGVLPTGTGTDSDDVVQLNGEYPDLFNGCRVTVNVLSGLSNIVNGGTYYVIVLGGGRIQLADTLGDAVAAGVTPLGSDGTLQLVPPSARLMECSEMKGGDAATVRYSMLFATTPYSWNDAVSYPFTFPALTAGTAGTAASVTSIAGGSTNEVIIGSAVSGVAVNDTVSASVQYTRGGTVFTQSFYGKALAVSAGVSVTMQGNLLGAVGSASSVSGSIREVAVGRSVPKDVIASGRIQHDYAVTDYEQLATVLPLFQPFRAVDNTGNETDTLTTSTTPTSTEYFNSMNSGGEIVVECVWERYLGNIWVRKTTFLPTQ